MTDRGTRRSTLRLVGIAGLATVLAGRGDPSAENDGDRLTDDAWDDIDEIDLEVTADGWIGVEPDPILDEQNPTLVLDDAEEYEISWGTTDGEAETDE